VICENLWEARRWIIFCSHKRNSELEGGNKVIRRLSVPCPYCHPVCIVWFLLFFFDHSRCISHWCSVCPLDWGCGRWLRTLGALADRKLTERDNCDINLPSSLASIMKKFSHGTSLENSPPLPTNTQSWNSLKKQPGCQRQDQYPHTYSALHTTDSKMKGNEGFNWLRTGTCLATILLVLMSFSVSSAVHARSSKIERATDARTPDVQFDNYSLFLKGQRVFL